MLNIRFISRPWLWAMSAMVFSACSSQYPSSTPSVTLEQPIGATKPLGYVYTPNGSDASYQVVSFQQMPSWQTQSFTDSLLAFRKGCEKLQARHGWGSVCRQANQISQDNTSAKSFFERNFTPWQVAQKGATQGLFTGYYEPVLSGDRVETARARFPIYGVPQDFISVNLPTDLRNSKATVRVSQTGANTGVINSNGTHTANLAQFPITERSTSLKGRFVGNQFVPYHTRNDINGGALNGVAPILAYADNPVELFFLHIQGSGRIRTPDGQYIRIGYADKNEYPYVSIGRYMADKGYLPLAQTSMQGIKGYLAQNPNRLAEILGQNPSYVFFRQVSGSNSDGPVGALGVPLSSGYSGAVDKHYITLGAPLFISTTHPDTKASLNRLIMAQDTGSAIKGAVRVDYFWGYGDGAGQTAGKMKNQGYVWQLLPNGMLPSYQP